MSAPAVRRCRRLAAVALLFVALPLAAQQNRTVEGVVLDARNHAVANAVVYLKNVRSQAVRSYITANDGKYVFHALAANTDYEVHAEFERRDSSTRTVSAYDTRATIHLDLKIPLAH